MSGHLRSDSGPLVLGMTKPSEAPQANLLVESRLANLSSSNPLNPLIQQIASGLCSVESLILDAGVAKGA